MELYGSRKTFVAIATLYKGATAINNRFFGKKMAKFSKKDFNKKVVEDYVNSIGIDRWKEIC